MSQTYLIHDNGSRPFKVNIQDLKVSIYKQCRDNYYEENPLMTFDCKKIFVGTSPLNSITSWSGGFGIAFDGNSILLHLDGIDYVYIGKEIYKFKSFGEIITYISPVGNNNVPYPYAIDEHDNYYLMIEDVVIMRTDKTAFQMLGYSDPYNYYYCYDNISKHDGFVNKFYVGTELSMLTYNPNPDSYYDWLIIPSDSSEESDSEDSLQSCENNKLYIVDSNNNKIVLTKQAYIDLIQRYGESQSFCAINNKIILQERLW